MNLLRVKDNSFNNKELFVPVGRLSNRIANKTLKQLTNEGLFVFPSLVEDSEDLAGDKMILQCVNDSYCTGNVMGFIGCGDERLVIESRFSNGDDFFLQYMLDKVLELPNIVNLESDTDQDARLFNFLLFLFPSYLKAAMRKGLYKTYTRIHYNDMNVKGTIEIPEHIRRNTPFVGNISYSQREFSFDNSLMELVRHTIEFIKGKPYGKRLLATVKDEVSLVIGATSDYSIGERQRIIEQNIKNAVGHAYYHEYRNLQRLCVLILRHQKHQIGSGSKQIYGILFDGAWLWEEYMNSLIGADFYHPKNKKVEGWQWLFAGSSGQIFPDFISRNSVDRIIADAKYKPVENIANKDYLQILAYMFRFDAKKGYYLYPETELSEDRAFYLNAGTSFEANVRMREDICVIKHGLRIPSNAESYDCFKSMMEVFEDAFVRGLQ